MALESIKKLFGDKAMTYDELSAAYTAQEGAKDGVKLVNLSEGGYVSAQKYRDKEAELKAATDTITGLQDTVKKFDGVDIEKLKAEAAAAQAKFDTDLATARKESAIHIALIEGKARNVKAVRGLLDDAKITLNADGTLSGLDIKAIKKSDPYLFEVEQKQDEGGGHSGGSAGGGAGAGKDDEIMSALYGTAAK